MKKLSVLALAGSALLAGSVFAGAPEVSVSQNAHPDMAEAQKHVRAAWAALKDADQRKNPEAAARIKKIKEMLVKVNDDIRAAADASNAAKQERREEKKEAKEEKRVEKIEKKQDRLQKKQDKLEEKKTRDTN